MSARYDSPMSSSAPRTAAQSPDAHDVGEGLYIRQVALMLGVSSSTIRAWEADGLLTPKRSTGGYRVYTAADVRRLAHIRDLRDQGINATGVRAMLEDEPPGGPQHEGVGERLRRLRQAKGQSLREVSRSTGLSPSYISTVERSISSPSIASLQKLAAALGTNIPGLLGSSAGTNDIVVRAGKRAELQAREDGVTLHRLSVGEQTLEPLLFTIEPGAGSAEPYEHDGEEFILVMEGTFEITLDRSETHVLERGDSVTFRSRRPHSWINPGETVAALIWVNTPPTF